MGFRHAPAFGPEHHGCRPILPRLDLDIRALRGPLTREALAGAGYPISDDLPYGDPGLLVPHFYARSPHQVDDFCLVPHHSDYKEWRWKFPGFNVIDIGTPTYESIGPLIMEITKYRMIFSSSLHVTILCESFGIPVVPTGPKLPFKFDDFYAGVGKKVDYLPVPSADTDWVAAYESALQTWQPIRWDPLPWLAAAPFPVSTQVGEGMARHYRDLSSDALRRRVQNQVFRRTLPKKLREYYCRLRSGNAPVRRGSGVAVPPLAQWTIGPSDWTACVPETTELPLIEKRGTSVGLNAGERVRHAYTEFFPVDGASEVRFRVPLRRIDGNGEILIQTRRSGQKHRACCARAATRRSSNCAYGPAVQAESFASAC